MPDRRGAIYLMLGVLVFGSIWGFFEATLGGFLNLIIFPNKGAIMSGIGIAIMSAALAYYKKPGMLPGIGLVAASFKLLDVWLFSLPITDIHLINPAAAIIAESLIFGAVAITLKDRLGDTATGAGAGVLAGVLSAVGYVYFAIYVTSSPVFERMGVNNIGEFVANQGLVQGVFSGVFVPIGYVIGERLGRVSTAFQHTRVYYAAEAAFICLCWLLSGLALVIIQ